jgi:hypothetical protein
MNARAIVIGSRVGKSSYKEGFNRQFPTPEKRVKESVAGIFARSQHCKSKRKPAGAEKN